MPRRTKKPKWPADLGPYVVETITMPDWLDEERQWSRCKIELIDYEGTWSFSYDLRIDLYGHAFPAQLKYRKAFEDRHAAFEAARAEIWNDIETDWQVRRWKAPRPIAKRVLKWIDELSYEGQMEFNLWEAS